MQVSIRNIRSKQYVKLASDIIGAIPRLVTRGYTLVWNWQNASLIEREDARAFIAKRTHPENWIIDGEKHQETRKPNVVYED